MLYGIKWIGVQVDHKPARGKFKSFYLFHHHIFSLRYSLSFSSFFLLFTPTTFTSLCHLPSHTAPFLCGIHHRNYYNILANCNNNAINLVRIGVEEQEGMVEAAASASDINSLSFSAWTIPSQSLVDYVLQMMTELNILKDYNLKKETIKDLLKTIQSAYNQNPFHCWLHAVSVTQMMYLFISKSTLSKVLSTRVCGYFYTLFLPSLLQYKIQSSLFS